MNDKNDKLFRCSTFNGDTADGRTLWPDWLRDVELVLDEWSWAVMNGKTMSHNKYKKLKGRKKPQTSEPTRVVVRDMEEC